MTRPPASPIATIIAALIFAGALIGVIIVLSNLRSTPIQLTIYPPVPTATALPSSTPAPMTVYVTGAIMQPGLHIVPPGSRVEDVITIAGGLLAEADPAQINRAAFVRDGDQIHVAVIAVEAPILPTPSGGNLVYINSAGLEELMTLPGIGPGLAQAILDFREANGAFNDLDALDAVSGIGESTLDEIAPLIVFD